MDLLVEENVVLGANADVLLDLVVVVANVLVVDVGGAT